MLNIMNNKNTVPELVIANYYTQILGYKWENIIQLCY